MSNSKNMSHVLVTFPNHWDPDEPTARTAAQQLDRLGLACSPRPETALNHSTQKSNRLQTYKFKSMFWDWDCLQRWWTIFFYLGLINCHFFKRLPRHLFWNPWMAHVAIVLAAVIHPPASGVAQMKLRDWGHLECEGGLKYFGKKPQQNSGSSLLLRNPWNLRYNKFDGEPLCWCACDPRLEQ